MQAVEKAMQQLVKEEDCEFFAAPVDLSVFDDYLDYCKHPMDLSTMLEKLRAGEYADANAMKPDFALIAKNCKAYNDEGSDIVELASEVMAMANDKVQAAYKSKGSSGQKRKAPGVSGAAGGGSKAKLKKEPAVLGEEMQAVEKAMQQLIKHEDCEFFAEPVDTKEFGDYLDVVKHPMDLSTMLEKLRAGEYADANAMKPDFALIVKNCKAFNDVGAPINEEAKEAMAMATEAVQAAFKGKPQERKPPRRR
jgi:rubrerythrin